LNKIGNPQIRSKAMTLAQVYRKGGRQEGRQEDIMEALSLRFGDASGSVKEAVFAVQDAGKLRTLLRAAIQCGSMEEFSEQL
jgi:hypothetical protein